MGMGIKELPLTSGKKIVKVFKKKFQGWEIRRSEENHFVLTHPNFPNLPISIPDHKEVDRYLLQAELRKVKITTKEFRKRYDLL